MASQTKLAAALSQNDTDRLVRSGSAAGRAAGLKDAHDMAMSHDPSLGVRAQRADAGWQEFAAQTDLGRLPQTIADHEELARQRVLFSVAFTSAYAEAHAAALARVRAAAEAAEAERQIAVALERYNAAAAVEAEAHAALDAASRAYEELIGETYADALARRERQPSAG